MKSALVCVRHFTLWLSLDFSKRTSLNKEGDTWSCITFVFLPHDWMNIYKTESAVHYVVDWWDRWIGLENLITNTRLDHEKGYYSSPASWPFFTNTCKKYLWLPLTIWQLSNCCFWWIDVLLIPKQTIKCAIADWHFVGWN